MLSQVGAGWLSQSTLITASVVPMAGICARPTTGSMVPSSGARDRLGDGLVGRPAWPLLQRLVALLSDLQAKDMYLHQQGIDTTTPAGKAMFQMCGVFAEFEHAMIREWVKAGLERARAQGKTLGRPRTPKVVENKIRIERRKGKRIKKIARELDIGASTVQWVVHELTPRTGHLG